MVLFSTSELVKVETDQEQVIAGDPGERRLACAVIALAAKDFFTSYKAGRLDLGSYRFLTGRADLSALWFGLAGLDFFTPCPAVIYLKMKKGGH